MRQNGVIDELAHLLPAQGPISIFIHRPESRFAASGAILQLRQTRTLESGD